MPCESIPVICDRVSNIFQIKLWNDQLTVNENFFQGRNREPIDYIDKADYPRKLYCFKCQNIEFQTESGDEIWSTTGSGEMECLPRNVGVYIVWGTWRTVEIVP